MAIPQHILDRLQKNDPDIVGLSLSREVESDEDVVKLVKALKDNTHLRWLTIQGRWGQPSIGDRSAALFRSCHHLVYLDLSYNKNITNSGAAALALNTSLETLFLRGCSVTPEGLKLFLNHDRVFDLRIAITSSLSEKITDDVKAKLQENKEKWECKLLGQRLERLSTNELSEEFYIFVRENPTHIQKLLKPIQDMAAKDFRHTENAITVGLILSNHLSKLTGMVAKKAAVYAQRYRILREAPHEECIAFQSERRLERKRSRSYSLTPPSEATERKAVKSQSLSLSPPPTPCSLSQSI
ncbi:MAG TPA: leucine-rich repeat domain-containing protein [Gammaproteobacteria bacterium]|nr:leucine-rich repeat domain-containing protein [Gammaproteobacteria bacterium]